MRVSISKDVQVVEDDATDVFAKDLSFETFKKSCHDSLMLPSTKVPSRFVKPQKLFFYAIIAFVICSLCNLIPFPKEIKLGDFDFDIEKFMLIQRISLLSILTTVAYLE